VPAASYHTVAHPLVLSLAIPESKLSRREGIIWSDGAGITLARKMIPEAVYLGNRYDEALFKYYRHLWTAYPGEMAWLYVRKFMAAGVQQIAVLRGQGGIGGRAAALLLKPMALLANGLLLLILFLGLTAGALVSAVRQPRVFPLMLALLSAAAILVLTESAIIMPLYVPSYHNYLTMYMLTICILGWQGVVSLVFGRQHAPDDGASARKTALYFDSISDDFHARMNVFDLQARLDWFDRCLDHHDVRGARVLDVGAGLGQFSDLARSRGGRVVPLDIAPRLVSALKPRFPEATRGSATSLPFATGAFNIVISSECIEHTPDPAAAVREMLRVLRPGGVLLLTTPNLVWRWSVWMAEVSGLRKFEGIENWMSRAGLRQAIVRADGRILGTAGLHILPFQLRPLRPLIRLMNEQGQWLKPLMINQCWIAQKRGDLA
jgi:SAM-dependent methyltransferase